MPASGSLFFAGSEPSPAPTPGRLAELEQELRQAHAEADLARQHLAALMGNLNEGMILVGATYQVVLINRLVARQKPLKISDLCYQAKMTKSTVKKREQDCSKN